MKHLFSLDVCRDVHTRHHNINETKIESLKMASALKDFLLSVYSCHPSGNCTKAQKDNCLFSCAELMKASVYATSAQLPGQLMLGFCSAWAWKQEVNIRKWLVGKFGKCAATKESAWGAARDTRRPGFRNVAVRRPANSFNSAILNRFCAMDRFNVRQ